MPQLTFLTISSNKECKMWFRLSKRKAVKKTGSTLNHGSSIDILQEEEYIVEEVAHDEPSDFQRVRLVITESEEIQSASAHDTETNLGNIQRTQSQESLSSINTIPDLEQGTSSDLEQDQNQGPEQEQRPSLVHRLERKVIPSLPRPSTFKRQMSELRERLKPD